MLDLQNFGKQLESVNKELDRIVEIYDGWIGDLDTELYDKHRSVYYELELPTFHHVEGTYVRFINDNRVFTNESNFPNKVMFNDEELEKYFNSYYEQVGKVVKEAKNNVS